MAIPIDAILSSSLPHASCIITMGNSLKLGSKCDMETKVKTFQIITTKKENIPK